jgi:hypothetical protein
MKSSIVKSYGPSFTKVADSSLDSHADRREADPACNIAVGS